MALARAENQPTYAMASLAIRNKWGKSKGLLQLQNIPLELTHTEHGSYSYELRGEEGGFCFRYKS
jgi:hypothetical protein|nr:hypothetical protein Q903MT_gene5342 [Picea sitchensis]